MHYLSPLDGFTIQENEEIIMIPESKSLKKLQHWWSKKSSQKFIREIIIYLFVLMGLAILILPFLWTLSTSLKPEGEVFLFPPKWIPSHFLWHNYVKAMTIAPFHVFLKNTLIVVFFAILGTLLSSSIVAFGFARLDFPGRDLLFFIVLGTMMLPIHVIMIPLFIVFRGLHWLNTLKPLFIPQFFAFEAFFVFLLKQFFMTIPRELDDAAKIDGCNYFGIYWRIILPLSKPALITAALFSFMWNWNDFLFPLIFLNDTKKYTLILGLNALLGRTTYWNILMAGTVIVMIPPLVIFMLTQRFFIRGIVMTGIKG